MLQNLSTLMFTEVGIEILEMLEFSKFKNITFYFVKHVSKHRYFFFSCYQNKMKLQIL